MISNKIKSSRGISLVSLSITIIVLLILVNIVVYTSSDNLKVGKLKDMQTDIENLRDKISYYYSQNGMIPAKLTYNNIQAIKEAGVISEAVDTGDFLIIDLSAIENLTLNYGRDFEKVKSLENLTDEEAKNYTDIYIINETSHNIFYVAGITINDETYYTDYTSNDIDTVSVDLKYIEGVRIPEGFYYVEGTKDTGIIIKNDDNIEYEWIVQNNKIEEVPSSINVEASKKEDFIKSVNAYKGYYKNRSNANDIMYIELENWSPVYDKEGIYRDKNNNTAYIPLGFSVSETPGQNTIDEGLVVKDASNNEWVWIEVPESIYVTAKSSEDYDYIEKDMQNYVSEYRDSGYADIWYEGCGIDTETEYNELKNKMLKSIYEKGGFYVGKYQAKTENKRTSNSNTLTKVAIKQGMYPYNYITCANAQIKSKELAVGGKTSGLMFGIQWDLVLKFIEEKGGKVENIYNLAENEVEWTLEQNVTNKNTPCTYRGNHTEETIEDKSVASYRSGQAISDATDYIGFRSTLY